MDKTFRSILVPVDFSPHATEALHYATSIAQRFSASLLALYVIAEAEQRGITNYHMGQRGFPLLGPYATPMEVPTDVVQAVTIDLHERSMTALQHFLSAVPAGLAIEPLVEVGHPATQILDMAERKLVDLIVMGTHGRTGLMHVIMGSIAERVVRQATCPVLTVKALASPAV